MSTNDTPTPARATSVSLELARTPRMHSADTCAVEGHTCAGFAAATTDEDVAGRAKPGLSFPVAIVMSKIERTPVAQQLTVKVHENVA